MAFGRDGRTLASGGQDGTVRLWDVATRRQIGGPLTGHAAPGRRGGVQPGRQDPGQRRRQRAMQRCGCGTWPPAGRSAPSPVTPAQAYSVAFSPDGRTLASGDFEGTVRLWDVATGRQVGSPLTGHTGPVLAVAFSRDGRTLASGGDDGTVRLWDVATGRPVGGPLTGHPGAVLSVAFSPDGRTLASGGADGTVRLWDVVTRRQIGPVTGHPGPVLSVAFSPDGRTLASGDANGLVRLWNVAYLTDIVPRLCASAGRSLTRTEWTRYAPGTTYRSICPGKPSQQPRERRMKPTARQFTSTSVFRQRARQNGPSDLFADQAVGRAGQTGSARGRAGSDRGSHRHLTGAGRQVAQCNRHEL